MKIFFNTLVILILIFNFNLDRIEAGENAKIILKVNNEIVTNLDVEKEYDYLVALNNDLKKINKKRGLEIAKESLIKEKIKKNELIKFFDLTKETEQLNKIIENLYKSLGFENKEIFQNYLSEFNLTYEEVKEKIKIESTWNQLIYKKYNQQVKIDLKTFKKKISNQKKIQNSYLLFEILYKKEKNITVLQKYDIIKDSIESVGFKNSANIYSLSDTSKLGGKIGWVD